MFFIFSKEKIASYIIAFSTIAVLFTISVLSNEENTIETSTNYVETNKLEQNSNINRINIIKNSLQ